jgi:hypothetical protein
MAHGITPFNRRHKWITYFGEMPKCYRPLYGVSSMHLKDAMRGREGSKRWRLAERWEGESPEARIVLRGTLPRASLTSYARQSSSNRFGGVETDADHRSDSAEGGRDTPAYPLPILGSHSAWMGRRVTCHLSHLV